ncbi:MAG: ATP-binding protein [Actinomycetota bacterium]|nr:ATP-binding protein [Actinomycetota bacterium]
MTSSPRILLVDDDPALLEALPEALRLRLDGIEIDTSETAYDALDRLREKEYDAIVSDIKMPGMDGLALLTETQRLSPGTPVLLITGHGEHDLAVQALRGGAYDFVQKPIDRDYFVASLERAVQMRRLDRQVADQQVLLEQHARLLEHVDNGVFLVDAGGLVRYWNPAAAAITGLAVEDVVGKPVEEALRGWGGIVTGVPVSSHPGPTARDATVPLDIEGRELWISMSGVELDDGIVYAFRNLTEERALDELKSEFVATVSHELRTPLSAIYGCAQTLRRSDLELDPETKERLLNVITQESERLTRIVGDILLANQLDAGRLRLERDEIDVERLVNEVVEEMRVSLAARDDISFEVAAPDSLGPVVGDSDKLRQILLNLVDNAVKYSPEGGLVEISVEIGETGLRLTVSDQGLGIPHGEQQRIFGKFYRVDPNLTRGVGGTGLGLYICRELARRMEGRVSVQSQEGKGSIFVLDLPLAPWRAEDRSAAATQTA